MSARILIDDLRNPVLTEDQRSLMAQADADPVTLTVDAVTAAAAQRAGLDDFGPDDFRERLALILGEVDEQPNYTELLRATFYNRAVAVLTNRLLALELLRRHPEIHERRIEGPLIIAGLPRSGTTHLLNLLAAGARFSSLRYWESSQPVPLPGELAPADHTADPRYRRSAAAWERLQRLNPTMAAYHPMDPDHIHEDLELQTPDIATYYWEWMARLPHWRDHYLSHDQTPHYAFGQTMLKLLDFQHDSTKRWVLKTPQHFEQLPAIRRVYPDALLIFTHRDPVASLQSIVTQLAYVIRTRERVVDPDWYYAYWVDRVERLLRAYVRDIEQVPARQRFDVRFDEFMADDLGTALRIHQAAGIDDDDALRDRLQGFLDTHARHQHGAIDHDLARDFGADVDALRERFSFYTDHVGLPAEVR
jgi:sulfotransferase family protein